MSTDPRPVSQRVDALRAQMLAHGLDAYLVPSADAHQNEYVPSCWQRRAWISGFTGSAGEVAITASAAGLWTDSRYFLQAETELDADVFSLFRQRQPDVPTLDEWICQTLLPGQSVGYDPSLLSVDSMERLAGKLSGHDLKLVAVDANLVDAIQTCPVVPPRAPAFALGVDFAGESVADKLARVRDRMVKAGAEALVVTTLDAIAWVYNVRGTDVPYNPVVISYALITADQAIWFVDDSKVSSEVRASLEASVRILPYAAAAEELAALGERRVRTWIDGATASAWVLGCLAGAPLIRGLSPIVKLKAVKNATEILGLKRCLARDGVAMVRFLRWLSEAVPEGGVTEASAAERLDGFRGEGEHFRGPSFETISAYGPHAAIPHYRVTDQSNLALPPEGVYLVDSGGQYLDGTTDITRTVALGPVDPVVRDRFTRVLRGHIDLARLSFPQGSAGHQLDLAARMPLWEAGLDYGHGTGHGVGFFLNVHEGPVSIAQRSGEVAFEPGMISSNEPGYYEAGAYGIRIENLVRVVRDDARSAPRAGGDFHRFETLTLCPIDASLVEPSQMSSDQLSWLDDYHDQVRDVLSPLLPSDADRAWLEHATRSLA